MEETRKLARFVSKLTFGDIHDSTLSKVKELILDQLGCQLAGSTLPWTKASYEYIKDKTSQSKESTIVYFGSKTTAQDAAFANANFGHGFMGDDTDSICHAHLGSIIIPAAMAMGEREKITGEEFIRAVVIGYEAASRVGAAARSAETRGFHPGPIFGPFGVAACTGAILGFDEGQMLDALGIAGSHSSGIMEYSRSGGTVNRLHSGIAASNGIRAALLAQRGFKGPATVLEGEKGFLRAFSNEYSPDEITRGLGREFRVHRIDLKAYCCCGTLSAVLDALTRITCERDIRPNDIDAVGVDASPPTYRLTGTITNPRDLTSAQFSGPFGVALRLLKGSNSFREYSEENLRDPQIAELITKIKFTCDEKLGMLPESDHPARVTLKTMDGRIFEETVLAGKGSILNPMSKEEVREKFRGFASEVLACDRVESIIQAVEQLHLLQDIHQLSGLLVRK